MYSLIMLTALGAVPGAPTAAPYAAPAQVYRYTANSAPQSYGVMPYTAAQYPRGYYGAPCAPGCCPTDNVDLFLPCAPAAPCAPWAPNAPRPVCAPRVSTHSCPTPVRHCPCPPPPCPAPCP